ncbi:MAG: rod shape-determining protein MreC [Planctomycetota bacterium]|nr:rod shape-determining protein MreC [Planctomycetota bacterium]
MRNRLKKLGDVPAFAGLEPLPCKVTYYDPVGAAEVLTLDVGSADGVQPGMVVCCGDVIVARIYKVAPAVSLAVTSRHRFFKMPVLLVDDEDETLARGIAEGNGIALEVRFVPFEQKVSTDAVALSNDESPFVPNGFAIGDVSFAEPDPSTRSWRVKLAPHPYSFELEELYIPTGVQKQPEMHVPREAR